MEKETNNCACFACGGEGKSLRIIAGVLLAVLAVYVAVLAVNSIKQGKFIGRDVAAQSTISVSGNGEVYKTPDLAVMDFSVVSEAKTVNDAMADNAKKMNAITDVIKSLGVAEKDMQTTGFNISPRYDYLKAATPVLAPLTAISATEPAMIANDSGYYSTTGKRVLAGYEITQTLTVKIRQDNMAKIGQIIQEATSSGANQVGDLQFTLDDPDAAQAEAREKAITDAKDKARILAKQLGVKLVRILNYNDGGYYPVARMSYAKVESMDAAAGGIAPNIQTGENKISINVNITYEIE